MKRVYIYFLLMACAVLMAGCQKEFDGVLNAVIEDYEGNHGKVYLDNENYACWHDNDNVYMSRNGVGLSGSKTVSIENDGSAQIKMWGDALKQGDILRAVYLTNRGGTVNFPGTLDNPDAIVTIKTVSYPAYKYKSRNNTIEQQLEAPMAACTQIKNGVNQLKFYNVGSLLKLTLKNPTTTDFVMQGVDVIATSPLDSPDERGNTKSVLWGDIQFKQQIDGGITDIKVLPSIDYINGEFVVSPSCNILNFGVGNSPLSVLGAGSEQVVYIAIPPVNSAFTVKVRYTKGGRDVYGYTKVGSSKINIKRNTLVNMGILTLGNDEVVTVTGLNGSGTAEDPYLITSAAEMNFFADQANRGFYTSYSTLYCDAYYKQIASFTLDETFPGIGNSDYAFSGHYIVEGNHTITNNSKHSIFNIIGGGYDGDDNGAVIEGLKVNVNDANVNGFQFTSGGVASAAYGGIVSRVDVTHENVIIKNCQVTGAISATDINCVGGIAGSVSAKTSIENCENSATITAGGAGGIVGRLQGVVNKCVNNGAITCSSNNQGGGIAAMIDNGGFVINCANHGAVVDGGGLVGTCNGKLLNSYSDGTGISRLIMGRGAHGGADNLYFDGDYIFLWSDHVDAFECGYVYTVKKPSDIQNGEFGCTGPLYDKVTYKMYYGSELSNVNLIDELTENPITLPAGVEKEAWVGSDGQVGSSGKPMLNFEVNSNSGI